MGCNVGGKACTTLLVLILSCALGKVDTLVNARGAGPCHPWCRVGAKRRGPSRLELRGGRSEGQDLEQKVREAMLNPEAMKSALAELQGYDMPDYDKDTWELDEEWLAQDDPV